MSIQPSRSSRGVRGWSLPCALALSALSASGCAAEFYDLDEPNRQICGGVVCFEPQSVSVRHWGAGQVDLVAFRSESGRCEQPRTAARETNPVAGSAIEVRLKAPRPGARLPIVAEERLAERDEGSASARALRVEEGTGRPLAEERAVSGEVTVLDVDAGSGRVRVRVRARWSSGATGELVLDVDPAATCS